MKKEFMLLIRNAGDSKKSMSDETKLAFVKKCEVYIDELKKAGKLLAAQPLDTHGVIVSRNGDAWINSSINEQMQIQVGYYHLLADDLEDAVAIAKSNPEFEYVPAASIEIRPVKTREEHTGFVYPGQKNA